jgi:2-polyprenyl-3-methyl-5-hydroxy-6-metoxy-1,4-benzoquinol methylase
MSREGQIQELAALYGTNTHWLWVRVTSLFGRDDFSGRRVLDVGAGNGMYSCALALLGAEEVVALEPTQAGSRSSHIDRFIQALKTLAISNVSLHQLTFEEYSGPVEHFDYILLHNVINHLDEDLVQTLHTSEQNRQQYAVLLSPVQKLLTAGGEVIIRDATRSHMLAPLIKYKILRRHPRARTIEWHKHQDPPVWEELLRRIGLEPVHTRPAPWTRYDWLRRLMGNNRLVSSLIAPYFILRARRP